MQRLFDQAELRFAQTVSVATERLQSAGQPGVHGALQPGPNHYHIRVTPGAHAGRLRGEGIQGNAYHVRADDYRRLLFIIACCPWLPLLRGGLCKSTEYS